MKVPKLHPIRHDLPGPVWCGPAALSAITGLTTSQVNTAIQFAREDWFTPVEGIDILTLVIAARRLGYSLKCVWTCHDRRGVLPSLDIFTRKHAHLWRKNPVVIRLLPGHYVMLEGNSFLDAHVPGPVPIRSAPGRNRRVASAWLVDKLAKNSK